MASKPINRVHVDDRVAAGFLAGDPNVAHAGGSASSAVAESLRT
jgi:hypothetical protein